YIQMGYQGKRLREGERMSLERLTNLFAKAVVASLLIGLVIGGSVVGTVCYFINQSYKAEIKALQEQLIEQEGEFAKTMSQELDAMQAKHDIEIGELEADIILLNETIDEYVEVNTYLTESLTERWEEEQDDFQLLSRYWYVFKLAKEQDGITTGVVRYVDEWCKEKNVNPHLMWGVYDIESTFDTHCDNAKSSARGLGQVLESSARPIYEKVLAHGTGSYTHTMAYDPYVNVEITVEMIARNMNQGLKATLDLYGDGTPTYAQRVLNAAASHGVTISESNMHYPY
ncbi:MAG: transglycosylase SLT domain-containing protein, partial [Muribaculaceae bacterium]|nr:transglycosylase SLT domain-containing protein [Muribaculaceae bacterium]